MTDTQHNSSQPRRGRPRRTTAESHDDILDAVYDLLQERSVRDLTMEAVAKKAGVGKPTLYKWWPTKAALVLATLHHRFGGFELEAVDTAETAIRQTVRWLIGAFNGQYGKIMADLIAEGQSDPAILQELYDQHIRGGRSGTIAIIERDKAKGTLVADADAELLVDAIFGALYYRLLLRSAPLTEEFGNKVIDQAFRGVRADV